MTLRSWRTAYASAAGTSHARSGTACQDAGRCDVVLAVDGSEVLVASVSDGAGSASQSAHGARLVVDAFQQTFADLAREEPDLSFMQRDHALAWLADMQVAIARMAGASGFEPRDYACTFLGAVVGVTSAAFLQIGDGAIVLGDTEGEIGGGDDGHAWMFWPQHGEFANSTFFVTMAQAAEVMEFSRREIAGAETFIREVILFSDGLERLVLDMRQRTVHSPSLRPILGWLAATEPPGSSEPSEVLESYLNSANVNRRTDDDKTLVMATRAHPPTPSIVP